MRKLFRRVWQVRLLSSFGSSADYWQRRYRSGLDSGDGSHGELAGFKREVLNEFLARNRIATVIDLGCGDGRQAEGIPFPSYLGMDVSRHAIMQCEERFRSDPNKMFLKIPAQSSVDPGEFIQADLTLSLDVVYHLVEDEAFEQHISMLFGMSRQYVIVYSSDSELPSRVPHVRHREFSILVQERFPRFRLVQTLPNRYPQLSPAEFFVFKST